MNKPVKLLSCEAIVTSEMECENACIAQEQLFDDWADMEEAENEAKLNEQQDREEADANGSTYSPSKQHLKQRNKQKMKKHHPNTNKHLMNTKSVFPTNMRRNY